MTDFGPRSDWTRAEIAALFDLPFTELVFRAAEVHRARFDPAEVQLSTLLSIKTGGCVEDCGYCAQSVKADAGVPATKLMDVQAVLQSAAQAKDRGSSRFCMGAAWRNPKDRDMPAIVAMVQGVRGDGPGNLHDAGDAGAAARPQMLADAGLDYYNHNIDTSPEHYAEVITTRTMDDRLDTLGASAQRRDQRMQRRHRRHGRDPRRPRRLHPHAGNLARASRKRADQRAGAGEGHGAGRYAGGYAAWPKWRKTHRRYRVRADGGGGADLHAREHGTAVGGAREHVGDDAGDVFLAGANSIFTGDKPADRA